MTARARWIESGSSWWEIEGQADRLGHELLVDALVRVRPDDAVLSEEGDDPAGRVEAERCWVVDPLDGSADFPDPRSGAFAVHVALVEHEQVVAAAVSLPAIDALHSTGSPGEAAPAGRRPVVIGGRSMVGLTHRLAAAIDGEPAVVGSSGVKAMAVVRGEADVYVHASELWEWDVCAPAAVAAAAGLHVCGVDGSPLLFNQPRPVAPGLVVCRPGLADQVMDLLT